MPYARTLTDRGGVVNFERLIKERREKAKKGMAKYGVDGLLLFDADNCRYLTAGVTHTGFQYLVYAIKRDEPITHFVGMNAKNWARGMPHRDIRYSVVFPSGLANSNLPAFRFQLSKFVNQIKADFKETGLTKGKVATDTSDPVILDVLKKEGINVSSEGTAILAEARLQKTHDEVECLRIAAAIAEGCFRKAQEVIHVGVTEEQVMGEMAKKAFELGAEGWDGGLVASGPNSWTPPNTITDRIIRSGDIILIDIYNLSYHGYRTCYYRNFSVGEPTKAQREAWHKARDFTFETIKIIKPGVSTRELVQKWPKAEEYGFDNEDDATFAQWAHGLGLSFYEAPIFSRIWSLDYPEEIKEDMVFSIETLWPTNEITGAYPYGQCLRIEDEVHVTHDGCDVLSQFPSDEITQCW